MPDPVHDWVCDHSIVGSHVFCIAQPGVTTDEIDRAVHKMIIDNGAYPSPLRYGAPGCHCAAAALRCTLTSCHVCACALA